MMKVCLVNCNVLIKDGILQGYMQDKLNARLMGVKPTGNGRRESYAHLPMPRMTNTYMLAGQSKFDDLIASVDRGIYAPHFGVGKWISPQVNLCSRHLKLILLKRQNY